MKLFYFCDEPKVKQSMSIFKPLFLLSSIFLILTSCKQDYQITGSSSIRSLDGRMLFMKVMQNGEWIKVDSAEIVHGLFSMNGQADSVMMATLYLENEAIMPVVLEKGKINITIADNRLDVKGTDLNNALYQFIDKRNSFETKLEQIDRKEARMIMAGGDIDEIQAQLNSESEVVFNERNEYIKSFISDNYDNVLGPNVFMMLCSSLPYPVLTPQIEQILDNAPYTFKTHGLVREFVSKAKENMELINEHQRMMQNATSEIR